MDVISHDYCNVNIVYYCTGIVGTLSWLFVSYIKLPDTQRYPELSFKKSSYTNLKKKKKMSIMIMIKMSFVLFWFESYI